MSRLPNHTPVARPGPDRPRPLGKRSGGPPGHQAFLTPAQVGQQQHVITRPLQRPSPRPVLPCIAFSVGAYSCPCPPPRRVTDSRPEKSLRELLSAAMQMCSKHHVEVSCFDLGLGSGDHLIKSHATCYRANQAVLPFPGAGGGEPAAVLFPLPCTCSRGRRQLGS